MLIWKSTTNWSKSMIWLWTNVFHFHWFLLIIRNNSFSMTSFTNIAIVASKISNDDHLLWMNFRHWLINLFIKLVVCNNWFSMTNFINIAIIATKISNDDRLLSTNFWFLLINLFLTFVDNNWFLTTNFVNILITTTKISWNDFLQTISSTSINLLITFIMIARNNSF